MFRIHTPFLLLILACLLPLRSQAQSVVRYAEPGYVTIAVNLWGDVTTPGRYEVAQDTDLIDLITLAGGPRGFASPIEYRVARIDVKISRLFPDGRKVFFKGDLEELISGRKHYPALQNEDVIVVRVQLKRKGINWQNLSIAVTTLTSLVILGLNLKSIL